MMINSVNDIFKQAHQGSVAAIIQVLNDKLTDVGVRTRAIFDHGTLHLLCEAATPEQLEQPTLTERIRQILEAIAPRGIRRVNINSRLVREQQLLWLDEISQDPEHLLWSQEVSLIRPSLLKRALEDWRSVTSDKSEPRLVSLQSMREQRQFKRGIFGGLGLGLAVLVGGFGLYQWWQSRSTATSSASVAPTQQPVNPSPDQPPSPLSGQSPTALPLKTADPFGAAVRLAEKAAIASQTAQTVEQWQTVTDMWGQAATLMATVPPNHPRYEIARDRAIVYGKNQAATAQKVK